MATAAFCSSRLARYGCRACSSWRSAGGAPSRSSSAICPSCPFPPGYGRVEAMGSAMTAAPQAAANKGRDPRLDFFRGSAMFIIFIAHCRGNFLWDYIPARFGLSDAADMFVFLSGMAASIAFGGTFLRQGMVMGTARILHRCWQLLIAHLGLFFTVAMVVTAGTRWYGDTDYVEVLNLQRFFADTPGSLIGLFTLTYVPHYFDILPLYIVVLAMVPIAML